MPVLKSAYRAVFPFTNPHIQTFTAYFLSAFRAAVYNFLNLNKASLTKYRERINTLDHDFIEIDCFIHREYKAKSLALVCHGLEASSNGFSEICIRETLYRSGLDVVMMNYRGCSGIPNYLLKSYHSGKTEDLDLLIEHILSQKKYSLYQNIYLVGNSIGANIILKYLGEKSYSLNPRIKKAFALSAPIDLAASSRAMAKSKNRLYMDKFLSSLKKKLKAKAKLFTEEINLKGFDKIKNFFDFDSKFTAPLNGFNSADDYWLKASAKAYLTKITIPTYILSSADDTFLTKSCYPFREARLNPNIFFECTADGGHSAFLEFRADSFSYAERKMAEFALFD